MSFSKICVTVISCATLLLSPPAHPDTFNTSFEFSNAGTFSIGDEPLTATFSGGRAQTVGIGAYYHSGRFSWHVPAGGLATVTFDNSVTRTPTTDDWMPVPEEGQRRNASARRLTIAHSSCA